MATGCSFCGDRAMLHSGAHMQQKNASRGYFDIVSLS